MLTLLLPFLAISSAPQRTVADPATVERRVDELLSKMTVEEKIDYLGGYQGFYTQPIERLHLPAFKMSDGPAGVRNYGPTTAYAAPVTIAASWDVDLARRVGRSFALDARQRGVHIVLAPGVNINRVPMNGRNFEYLGEDPYLASQMVVPWIQGIQGGGVMATVKHYAANSQEHGRTIYSMDVDERTLREIYFPAFEAAVKRGNVWSVMCAYNLLNGVYCSENGWLQDEVLKKEWGFKGFVMSDWGAVHSTVPVANGGLDLEMPGPQFLNRRTLLPALKDGTVKQATIDDKVRRMLRSFISMGFLDRPQTIGRPPYNPEGAAVTYEESQKGMVLLKNRGNVLPLDTRRVKKIAVIGPNAHPAVWGGGGSAFTTPVRATSILDAIVAKAGPRAQVSYASGAGAAPGEVFQSSRFTAANGEPGLTAEYFANRNLEGAPAVTRTDRRVNFHWENAPVPGVSRTTFSVRWTGTIRPAESGGYEFAARGDDGYRVWIDGKKVIDEWREQAAFDASTTLRLEAGHTYSVKVEYFQAGGESEMRFGWRPMAGHYLDEAVQTAKDADVAIVAVGFNQNLESEGDDRTFTLPAGQDELIRRVVEANPNTIVVLNAGGSVDATAWIDKVAGLVHAWYPGQDGNRALADILFGDVNPSGKLPMSFDRRWEDSAAFGNYPGDPEKKHVKYAEGIFVGYRHYDHVRKAPLFPFGFGLSYTTFGYSDLKATPMRSHEPQVRVEFRVRNNGRRAGAEVAQVYVQPPTGGVPRPVKELKGFARVELAPGASQQVVVNLDSRAFAYWDVVKKGWVVPHGEYRILVGGSSQSLPLAASVRL
jgi:beta-glucosidase